MVSPQDLTHDGKHWKYEPKNRPEDALGGALQETFYKLSNQLARETDKEIMEWLGADTPERAKEIIERLHEIGLTLSIQYEPMEIETIEDTDNTFKIEVKQDLKLKLIPLTP